MSTLAVAPAVRFALTNAEHEPVLTIGDGLAVNQLSFVVTNATATPLALFAGTPVPDGQPDPTGPTTFYLYFGSLLTVTQQQAMNITAPGWTATWLGDSATWALTPEAAGSLTGGASVAFTIGGVDVSGPEQSGHLAVDYSRVGALANGFTHLPLSRRSADAGSDQVLPLQIGLAGVDTVVTTVDANHPHENSLTVQLSTDVPDVAPTWDPARPPLFHLSFQYGDPGSSGTLTTRDLARDFKPSTAPGTTTWGFDPQPTGDDPVWTLRPSPPGPILGSVVVFTVDKIVTLLRPGPTELAIAWVDVPGFADGMATAVIQKIAPLTLSPLTFDPLWIPKGQTAAPTLHWSWTGDPTTLELVTPRDVPLDDAVATSMVSPVAVSTSTLFELRALRVKDDKVTVTSTTFPVVDFPSTSSDRIDAPGTELATALCRSPDGSVLYVAASENTSKTQTTTLLAFDATTKAQIARFDDVVPAPPGSVLSFLTASIWVAPSGSPGVNRVTIATGTRIVVWDVAADHSATKRAAIGQTDDVILLGMPTATTVLAVSTDVEQMSRQFTVVELDPLGVAPQRQVGPTFGGDGTEGSFGTFTLLGDPAYIAYLCWTGAKPGPDSGEQGWATVADVVVRKSCLADGALVAQATVGRWSLLDFAVTGAAAALAELDDGTLALFVADLSKLAPPVSPGEDPGPPDPTPGITWMPLDDAGTVRTTAPRGGAVALSPPHDEPTIWMRYSPNGTDVLIPHDDGLWIAPTEHPELGATFPVGQPICPPVFSPDGDTITVMVNSAVNWNSFELVTLTRSVVPPAD